MAKRPLDDQVLGVITMLVVDDLEESVGFYRDKLGFEVVEAMEHITLLRRGSMNLFLFTEHAVTRGRESHTLANLNTPTRTSVILDLVVRDCRAAYDELRTLGVEFLSPPVEPPWGGLRCFARDPNGYLIELEENPDSPVAR